jgi:hypothetical protein
MEKVSAQYLIRLAKSALPSAGEIAFIFVVCGFVLVERGRTMRDPFFFLPMSLFSAVLVGPILIESFRKNPKQQASILLRTAVMRAVVTVMLILILSLVLVNALSWSGEVALPTTETCLWAVILSITAALAAGAALTLFLEQLSPNVVKWGFRAVALAAILGYRSFPVNWSISWYALVSDWGITWMAFAWEVFLASSAALALSLIRRRASANT